MTLSVVRLGTTRGSDEGPRLGTVRRPPRGVPKSQFQSGNWYDVWLPNLAPSADLVAMALQADSDRQWQQFERRYRAEMNAPDVSRVIDTLALLSHTTNFAIGCYCENEARCHRSVLRKIFSERGASLQTAGGQGSL